MTHYILSDNGNPIQTDVMTWAKWFEDMNNRRLAETEIGNFSISTVFLGLDHNWSGGPPILWETMIFPSGPDGEEYQERYSSRSAAIAGHQRACNLIPNKERSKMTKAQEYAEACKKQPVFRTDTSRDNVAFVDEDGYLRILQNSFEPKNALALAKWILEMFE